MRVSQYFLSFATKYLFHLNQVQNLSTPALIVFKDIVRQEGIGALYNGLTPTLIRTIPATAILFVTVEYTKKLMHNYF